TNVEIPHLAPGTVPATHLRTADLLLLFFQAEDGIRDRNVTGVQTCALPISARRESKPARKPCAWMMSGAKWWMRRRSSRIEVTSRGCSWVLIAHAIAVTFGTWSRSKWLRVEAGARTATV